MQEFIEIEEIVKVKNFQPIEGMEDEYQFSINGKTVGVKYIGGVEDTNNKKYYFDGVVTVTDKDGKIQGVENTICVSKYSPKAKISLLILLSLSKELKKIIGVPAPKFVF